MPVIFKGGTSGNHEGALQTQRTVDVSFDKQEMQDTSTNAGFGDVHFALAPIGKSVPVMHNPVPTGGTPDDGAV